MFYEKISSEYFFLIKKYFKLVFVLIIFISIISSFLLEKFSTPWLIGISFIQLFFAYVIYQMQENIFKTYVDAVYIGNDHLIIKNIGKDDKVFFNEIEKVNTYVPGGFTIFGAINITLILSRSSITGKTITFVPELKFLPSAPLESNPKCKISENLKERVHHAKSLYHDA